MKLEHVTIDDMLRSYLKSNFANRNTLVIWPLSMCDSEAEVETIKQDVILFTSKNMNIAEIIILLIHIGILLLHAAFIAFSVSDSFYLSFLGRQKETIEELLTINETK